MRAQFYFAWVNAGAAFDSVAHAVEDEKIVRFEIEHLETEFADLSVDVRNPKIGLLAVGRKQYAWFSVSVNGDTPQAMFYGRLVAIPSNMIKEVVTLQFVARPTDFGAQKRSLAALLRELPYFDPVFIKDDKIDDPDAVLEARTQVWHVDRVTHVVTTSDLLVGEDGVIEFEEGEVPLDSVSISLDQPPIRTVRMTADVPWHQVGAGTARGFRDVVYTGVAGRGLIGGWPEPGADIGGGWSVADNTVTDEPSLVDAELLFATETSARSRYDDLTDEELTAAFAGGDVLEHLQVNSSYVTAVSSSVSGTSISQSVTHLAILEYDVHCSLALQYAADRDRKDIATFDLTADSQAIVTMPDDDDFLELKISGRDVGIRIDPLDQYSEIPLGTGTARSYFRGQRGQDSLAYLMNIARAHIVYRSRAVKIEFECDFVRALELSLRKNARINDRHIPGGTAVGKIVGYRIRMDGGRLTGAVTLACCVGYGGSVAADHGENSYIDDDYIEDTMYERYGEVTLVPAGDLGFTFPYQLNPNDDGIEFPLTRGLFIDEPRAVEVETREFAAGIPQVQANVSLDDCGNTTSISQSMTLDTGPISNWLGGVEAHIEFSLKNLEGGPFETTYPVTCTLLKLPKQIDLEADAL